MKLLFPSLIAFSTILLLLSACQLHPEPAAPMVPPREAAALVRFEHRQLHAHPTGMQPGEQPK